MAERAGPRLAVALILLAAAAGSILAQGFALPSGINASTASRRISGRAEVSTVNLAP